MLPAPLRRLCNSASFVPVSQGSATPSYMIVSGLVLLQFTLPYYYERELSGKSTK